MIRLLPSIFAAGALLAAGGYVWTLNTANRALRAELAVQTAILAGCQARNANLTEDRASDTEIDNTTADPDSLRDAARRWLRPEDAGDPGQ